MVVRGEQTMVAERRPLFEDKDPPRLDVNPFVALHRELQPTLLPASEAWRFRGRWDAVFGRSAPLHVEIGCGNGFFLSSFAAAHPEYNVIGLEIRYKRTVLSTRKLLTAGVQNARVVRYDATCLEDLFEPASLSGLYVNHPDPWPKDRHEKHRLIALPFLRDAALYLRPGAPLRVKSDHHPNVDRVPIVLAAATAAGTPLPFDITAVVHDVDTLGVPWEDHETNYHRKSRDKGLKVAAVEVVRRP